MTIAHTSSLGAGGIRLRTRSAETLAAASHSFLAQLAQLGLQHHIQTTDEVPSPEGGIEKSFYLRAELAQKWAPGLDTTNLTALLQLDTEHRADDLDREILLALLLSPVAVDFPSHAELASAVRIRRNLVVAARKTALAFHTTEVDRPEDCWIYATEQGFTVRTGHALIAALQKATQPEASGKLYSFSCYRATEYVILLAIAQELAQCNPALLERLQQQWERRAITSGQFHEVFLREYGSMEAPLPPKYYVPGDPSVVSQSRRAFVRCFRLRRLLGFLSGGRPVHQSLEARSALHPDFQVPGAVSLAPRHLPR